MFQLDGPVLLKNRHLYVISSPNNATSYNVTTFQQTCANYEGYLVEINGQNEWNAVVNFLKHQGPSLSVPNVIIGHHDVGHAGNYTSMTTNRPLSNHWSRGQPNGHDHCVMIDTHFGMNDIPCVGTQSNNNRKFMCEIKIPG